MSAGSDRRMSLNQDEQAANDPANMDPPINQVCFLISYYFLSVGNRRFIAMFQKLKMI